MMENLGEQLTTYLRDAHSIEEQSLQQLRSAPDIAGEPAFAKALEEHYRETESHESRIRELLDERDSSPGRLKDAVMRAGGEGFLLFARSQPDTTGKLAAHALSYEALEWASYDLLARIADRAGEHDVARVAGAIRDEERAMMERIEGLFDRTVEASLQEVVADDLGHHLRNYLADAHAIEAQSIQLLSSGRKMVAGTTMEALFDEHLTESRAQQELIEERLEAAGGSRSLIKDAAMRLGALDWGTFFLGQPDTPAKLTGFAYAFEYLEIGGYEQLRRVAARAGDTGTVDVVTGILAQERATARKLAAVFGEAVSAGLAERSS